MRRWFFGLCAVLTGLAPAQRSHGAEQQGPTYRPLAHYADENVSIELPASARMRLEGVSTFPLDRYGTTLDKNLFVLPNARVGVHAETRRNDWPAQFFFDYEHDLVTGTEVGVPEQAIGERLPNGVKSRAELRRLSLRAALPRIGLTVSGGYTMSHWGLGMMANDGAHGWTPGSARFSDPRSGDRVIRATIGSLPLTDYKISVRAAYDKVVGDDVLLDHDTAYQVIGSIMVGQGLPHNGGLYVVYRHQNSPFQRGFNVTAFDLTGSTMWDVDSIGRLTLSAEAAVVAGSTALSPSVDFPKHDILQIGTAWRAELNRGNHGLVFDLAFATGDENFDDRTQHSFKMDPNYEMGLLLFRQVMAAQSGRTTVTAADPALIGRPVPDLNRVPTGGSPTNTISIFPRAWWRSEQNLELYGGPLFAFTDVAYADPFNTRIGGGDPHNALGGSPGRFYGTELDLGARYHAFVSTAEVILGLEGGVLFPGNAFRKLGGGTMSEVFGGRFMIDCRL